MLHFYIYFDTLFIYIISFISFRKSFTFSLQYIFYFIFRNISLLSVFCLMRYADASELDSKVMK